jgi:hypothetical protein
LCEKLESLSRKLHRVDAEILAGEVTVQPQPTSTELTVQIQTNTEVSYRMSPKMVATELAQHIEDIFADHDVEILAVDADDDSDDGTFVSARSHKSVKSIKSKKIEKKRKSPRQSNLFESNEENALALQIEAMAVQAEEAFGNRHGRKSVNTEDVYEVPEVDDSFENMEVIPEKMESADILDTMKLLTRGSAGVDVSNCTLAQKEAFSRNFLNTSTSMGEFCFAYSSSVIDVFSKSSIYELWSQYPQWWQQLTGESTKSTSYNTSDVPLYALLPTLLSRGKRNRLFRQSVRILVLDKCFSLQCFWRLW